MYLISWALGIGSITLLATWVWYWVSTAEKRSDTPPVPSYSYNFMEHQNYWEADNR